MISLARSLETKEVTSKAQHTQLFLAGSYGNRLRAWSTLKELLQSGFNGLVSLRCVSVASSLLRYDMTVAQVTAYYQELVMSRQVDPRAVYLCESAPDQHITFQGEAMRTPDGLYIYGSHERKKMRISLANSGKHFWRLQAEHILRHYMNGPSYDDFQELHERYSTSVLEFSCYRICLGDCPHRNVIVWEVRTTF